jgi:hypothetical protein
MLTKQQKEDYNKLCKPSAERDPNTGELVPSSADFIKDEPAKKPEEKKK